MTYDEFQERCLYYGFLECHLSQRQFVKSQKYGFNFLWSIQCDMAIGLQFSQAFANAFTPEMSVIFDNEAEEIFQTKLTFSNGIPA